MAKIVFELDFGVAVGNGTEKIGIQAHPALGFNLTGGDVIAEKTKNTFSAITTGAKTLFHITTIDKKEVPDAIEMKNVEEADKDNVIPKKSRRKKKPIEETKTKLDNVIDYREVITES